MTSSVMRFYLLSCRADSDGAGAATQAVEVVLLTASAAEVADVSATRILADATTDDGIPVTVRARCVTKTNS